MFRPLAAFLAFAAAMAAAPARAEEPFYDDSALYKALFGHGEANVCFARVYDSTHMKAHPNQNVVAVSVDVRPAKPEDAAYGQDVLILAVKFAFRPRGAYEFAGRCAPTSAEGEPAKTIPGCAAPNRDWADDGPILFALDGKALVVKLPPGKDFSGRPGVFGGDDRAFRLDPAAAGRCPLKPPATRAP